jgi:hypothetical protein
MSEQESGLSGELTNGDQAGATDIPDSSRWALRSQTERPTVANSALMYGRVMSLAVDGPRAR